jgi:outer membrane protein assembly factor BamB
MIGLKPKWETSIPEGKGQGSPHISVFGDCVYHEHSESAIRDTFSYLVRTNLKIGGSWDTIFSIVNTDGFTPNLSSVTGYKHPSGDTILFFQDRSYNFRSREGRINLYAYNIKADTLLWKLTDFVPERNSNVIQAPIVYENKLYFLGSKDLYCIDVSTGKIIWNRKVESFDNVIVGSVNISDGKLFFKSVQNSSLYALDPATGAVLWVSNDLGYSTRYITYSNGIVYFASRSPNKIYAVRSSDGKKMAEFTSPNHSKPGKTKGNTTIIFVEADPKTGYLYVNDSYFFMCLKPKI